MLLSQVFGSFINNSGNTRLKAPHLSTKRNIGTTRAIAKPNTWNGPPTPCPPPTPNNPFPHCLPGYS